MDPRKPSRSWIPTAGLCLAILFGSLSCVKRAEPPAPAPPSKLKIEQALKETQASLEKLRESAVASKELLDDAQDTLGRARKEASGGQSEKAYELVLEAQRKIRAARATAALAASEDSPEAVREQIKSLKKEANQPQPKLDVPISRAEAERAINEVASRLRDARAAQEVVESQIESTENLLKEARAQLEEGLFDKAYNLAQKAGRALDRIQAALRDKVRKMVEKLSEWKVKRKDNLWDISSDDRVYGDPILWPFIYRANKDKIWNPDLIYPGWKLGIVRGTQRDDLKSIPIPTPPAKMRARTKSQARRAKEPIEALQTPQPSPTAVSVIEELPIFETVPSPSPIPLPTQTPVPLIPTAVPPSPTPVAAPEADEGLKAEDWNLEDLGLPDEKAPVALDEDLEFLLDEPEPPPEPPPAAPVSEEDDLDLDFLLDEVQGDEESKAQGDKGSSDGPPPLFLPTPEKTQDEASDELDNLLQELDLSSPEEESSKDDSESLDWEDLGLPEL